MTESTTREGESTWAKLRRRKVVQWGIVYAAGAWGFLQGLEYASSTFDWPRQIQQLSTLALLIGLPIVLVLAWYHGDRGHQRVTRVELAILTLLFLFGGALFWRYQGADEPLPAATPGTAEAKLPATAIAAAGGASIAVLPFENRSARQDDAFFVDGIHDDILTQLSKISALKVISRTSVERFRETDLSAEQIAEQLGVKSILEGGVQRAGNRVRINVQLIDAGTDTHLWAETYDRELTAENIFAIQTEVSSAIAAALKANLTPAEVARVQEIPTSSLQAWEAYQLGKRRMVSRTSRELAEAEKFFRKAIGLDPKFALAWVGLADTLDLQVSYSGAPRDAALAEAEKSAAKALELDPNLAEAWASAGNVAMDSLQYVPAEPMFRRAIELNPNYATAYHWFSLLLGPGLGRYDEALLLAEKSAALDPLSPIINLNLGAMLESRGRFGKAEACYRRAIEIDPSMSIGYTSLGTLEAYSMNRFADAVPLVETAVRLDPGGPRVMVTLAMLQLDLGDDAGAERLIESGLARWPDSAEVISISAYSSLYRGDGERSRHAAQKLFDLDPRGSSGLELLRNGDLLAGHPEVARARYARTYPELLTPKSPEVNASNWGGAIDLALVLQNMGEDAAARVLLDRSEPLMRATPRLGLLGHGIVDAQIHALRGEKAKALAALREAGRAGWRGPLWRYFRDFEPNLASIRNEPEFKSVFADIERDMARQRAELVAGPKDAPLDLDPVR